MENVWMREISDIHACFVDLFDSIPIDEQFNQLLERTRARAMVRYKDNALSTAERDRGNTQFFVGNAVEAMHFYTSSLRYAEIGSKNVAMAYGNRSACFYRLGMYAETLVDIDHAVRSGMPHQSQQFEERRKICLESINTEEGQQDDEVRLDYANNEHFPCLASVVDVNYDPQFGRHLVANSDIPEGKVILVEEAFAAVLNDWNLCYTCFQKMTNFIPCESCIFVVFCSRECMDRNNAHTLECGSLFGVLAEIDVDITDERNKIRLIVQTVLNALSIFHNVENLMEFVETILTEHPDQLPESILDSTLKYKFYFKLKRALGQKVLTQARHAFELIMQLPRIRALFDTKKKQRFLMHLIAHHASINEANATCNQTGIVVGYLDSLWNHSCEPNVVSYTVENITQVETTRRVKQGDQLFTNYLSAEDAEKPKSHRQRMLQNFYGFFCECTKCEREL